ncbi:MAG TPA: hypothetical protein VF607_08785 [Verrucomicrobiae bacterium]
MLVPLFARRYRHKDCGSAKMIDAGKFHHSHPHCLAKRTLPTAFANPGAYAQKQEAHRRVIGG